MQKTPFLFRFAGAALVALSLAVAVPAYAENPLKNVDAVNTPILKLKHWKNSTEAEKMAFLFGVASMIELEREWQEPNLLPIGKSTIGSFVNGLKDVTIGDMRATVDKYVEAHPDRMEQPVLGVIGQNYVRPKMLEKELKAAAKKVEQIKKRGKK